MTRLFVSTAAIALTLSGCNAGGIDCASSDTRNAVGRIYVEHSNNEFTRAVFDPARKPTPEEDAKFLKIEDMVAAEQKALNAARSQRDANRMAQDIAEAKAQGRPLFAGTYTDNEYYRGFNELEAKERAAVAEIRTEIDARGKRIDAEIAALAPSNYQLSAIRTTARNADTGALACAATLTLTAENWGTAHDEITYLVEKTSGGGFYTSVTSFK